MLVQAVFRVLRGQLRKPRVDENRPFMLVQFDVLIENEEEPTLIHIPPKSVLRAHT